jgi:hypothetical protein
MEVQIVGKKYTKKRKTWKREDKEERGDVRNGTINSKY